MQELSERKGIVRLRLITTNARLVDARKAAGFTQPAFAAALGMGKLRMHQIETLKRVPSEDEICRIAVALEQMPEYLFPDRLLKAVEAGVFGKRQVELEAPHLGHLLELRQPMLLTDGGIDKVEERVDRQHLRDKLEETFTTLTPREVRVLKLRFGFDGNGARTLEEVGKKFNLTRETVRHIEGKALRRLRHPKRARELKSYLD